MTERPSLVRNPPLEAWSRAHALAMGAALIACAMLRAAWPVALLAAPSFLYLGFLARAAFTPSGRFGLANTVTTLRWFLVLSLSAAPSLVGAGLAITVASGVLLLDLLDGWLARTRGDSSAFGGHFDMETDALLVLLVTLRLWLAEGFAVWVLFAGLLRYGYVLSLWWVPGTGRDAPRSTFGRYAFMILMLGLLAALALHGVWGSAFALLGTLAATWSFGRSYYFSYSAD